MSALDDVIKDINKQFKSNIANKGVVFEKVGRIPFSTPRLNYMLYGGMPMGRLVEFFGPEGGGKTTAALNLVGQCQKLFPDKKAVFVDVERTLDIEWAIKMGVDIDSLYLITPDSQTAEEIFDMVEAIVKTGEVSICVIDSVGVMVSKQAYEKKIEDKTYGGISQSLTLFSKRIIPICARTKCLLVGINQVRDDMNSSYGGTVTTGGRAWRHNCSVRMEFTQSDYIDEVGNSLTRGCENPAGHYVKVRLVKSKVCRLDRKVGFYTLKYLTGMDYVSDTIDVALKENFITKAGAWFSIVDPETGELATDENGEVLKFQGRPKLYQFLCENEAWFEELTEAINTKIS